MFAAFELEEPLRHGSGEDDAERSKDKWEKEILEFELGTLENGKLSWKDTLFGLFYWSMLQIWDLWNRLLGTLLYLFIGQCC